MTSRQEQFRSLANSDIEAAVEYYCVEGGDTLAVEFVDAIQQAVERVRRLPNAGSLRFSYELGIADLRAWRTQRFPYVIFCVPHGDRIDVLRVLHSQRDIPVAFADGS